MIEALKSWLPIVAVIIAFVLGNEYGQARVNAAWTKSDNEALTAYKNQTEAVLKEKDEKISRLLSDISSARKSHADIVRKLDAYKNRERTLEQCRNDRARMADVAVGLDDFAQRLVVRTRSMMK
jgi:hypothetical protein